nr:vegetative cell wall protein gp1-like [Penaeus vannamei]
MVLHRNGLSIAKTDSSVSLPLKSPPLSGPSSSLEDSRQQTRPPRPSRSAPPSFPTSRRARSLPPPKPAPGHQAGLPAAHATSSTSLAHPALVILLPELLPPPFPVPIPAFHFVPVPRPALTSVEEAPYFSNPAQGDVVTRQDKNADKPGYSASGEGEGGNDTLSGSAVSSPSPSSASSPLPSLSSVETPFSPLPLSPLLVRSSSSSSAPNLPSSSPGFPPEDIEPRVNPIAFPSPDDPKLFESLSKDRIIFPSTTEKAISFPSRNSPQPPSVTPSPPFTNATVVPTVAVVSENNTDIRVSIIAPHRPCTRLCQYPAGAGVCLTDFTCIRNINFLRIRPQAVKNE